MGPADPGRPSPHAAAHGCLLWRRLAAADSEAGLRSRASHAGWGTMRENRKLATKRSMEVSAHLLRSHCERPLQLSVHPRRSRAPHAGRATMPRVGAAWELEERKRKPKNQSQVDTDGRAASPAALLLLLLLLRGRYPTPLRRPWAQLSACWQSKASKAPPGTLRACGTLGPQGACACAPPPSLPTQADCPSWASPLPSAHPRMPCAARCAAWDARMCACARCGMAWHGPCMAHPRAPSPHQLHHAPLADGFQVVVLQVREGPERRDGAKKAVPIGPRARQLLVQ